MWWCNQQWNDEFMDWPDKMKVASVKAQFKKSEYKPIEFRWLAKYRTLKIP